MLATQFTVSHNQIVYNPTRRSKDKTRLTHKKTQDFETGPVSSPPSRQLLAFLPSLLLTTH
jgi:hypothetical protein